MTSPLTRSEAVLLDLGSGVGASLIDAQGRFGMRGLGIERDPERVERARARGLDVEQGDILELDPADFPAVEYVTLDNVLEHLPTLDDVATAVGLACRIASRLVVIRHPSFEDVEALAALDLKLYWTDWPRSHTAPARLHELVRYANEAGVHRVVIQPEVPIRSSASGMVLPIGAPPDQTRLDPAFNEAYDEARHGPKPIVEFDRPVFASFELLLVTGEGTPEVVTGQTIERPELRWREIPGHAPSAWPAELAAGATGTPVLVERADGHTVVVEAGTTRMVNPPVLAIALAQVLDHADIPEDELRSLPKGPAVTALKATGEPAFVVVGGRRHAIGGLPITRHIDADRYAQFPEGQGLDLLRAASLLQDRRRAATAASAASSDSAGTAGGGSTGWRDIRRRALRRGAAGGTR